MEGEKMNPEIDVNGEYVPAESKWKIEIKIPGGSDPLKTGQLALELADEFMKITKEKLEIEAKKA